MVLSVRAIRPTRAPIGTDNVVFLVERELAQSGFAGEMIRRMADYPGQQPTRYRRTGTYGRGWKIGRRSRSRNTIAIEVINRVRYAIYVGGPRRGAKGRRQAREMRRRGWPNITTVSRTVFRRFRPRIVRILTQADPRIRRRRFRR